MKSILTRGQANRKRVNNDVEGEGKHDRGGGGGGGGDGKDVVRIPLAKKSSPPPVPPQSPSEIGDSPDSPICQLHDGDGTMDGHVCDACYDLIHEEAQDKERSLKKTTHSAQNDDIVIVPHLTGRK